MQEVFDWLQSQTPEPDIVQIKRHLEIISNQTYSDTEISISLELLTDLLHQIDNGVDFTKVQSHFYFLFFILCFCVSCFVLCKKATETL